MKQTIIPFWHMIWQEQVGVIVMAARCVGMTFIAAGRCDACQTGGNLPLEPIYLYIEGGRSKCASYWPPEGQSYTFGRYAVSTIQCMQDK